MTPPTTTTTSLRALRGEGVEQLGHQRLVAGGLARDADDVDVVLHRRAGHLLGCLEQRPEVDVEAEVGKGGADHLGPAVVSVLAHLGHEDPRAAPVLGLERLDVGLDGGEPGVVGVRRAVHTRDRSDLGAVATEHVLHRLAHLSDRRPGSGGVDAQRQQVGISGGALAQPLESRLARSLVALGAHPLEPGDLLLADLGVVDVEHVDMVGVGGPVLVDADDDLLATVDAGLAPGGGLLDAELRHAGLDRLGHPAERLDLLDDRPRLLGEVGGEALDVVRAGERIDDLGHAGLLREDELRVPGDAGTEVGGEPERFVEGVRVQALRSPEDSGQRFDRRTDHIVVRVGLRQRHAAGLAVRTQHQRPRLRRAEAGHDAVPEQPGGAELGDLHEQVHADAEEEGQAAGEVVDVEAPRGRGADVLEAVGDREGQFEIGGRSGLQHVVAGDRDRVEPRHVPRRVLDDVGDDPHRWLGRVDVRVPDHELLEDVVLDGPGEPLLADALLLAGDDEAGEHREHGAVHRHRHAHAVERDLVEEDLHVLDRVDGHARLADVADDTGVIGVVAAVGGEVERHREAHLSGLEVAPVERVRLLGRREARVLADRPGPVREHRRPNPADERCEPGQRVDVVDALEVGGRCTAA